MFNLYSGTWPDYTEDLRWKYIHEELDWFMDWFFQLWHWSGVVGEGEHINRELPARFRHITAALSQTSSRKVRVVWLKILSKLNFTLPGAELQGSWGRTTFRLRTSTLWRSRGRGTCMGSGVTQGTPCITFTTTGTWWWWDKIIKQLLFLSEGRSQANQSLYLNIPGDNLQARQELAGAGRREVRGGQCGVWQVR